MVNKENTPNATKTLTLMSGGPASGKSTELRKRYPGLPVVDSDAYKMSHPDYDPKNPSALHSWSSLKATQEFNTRLAGDEDFAFDGTGTNAEKYVMFANSAHAAGWNVRLLYVSCDLKTALKRNSERARTVPENVVRDKYSSIAASFEIVSRYVDEVVVVNSSN
jgi:predicted ABC-type ATPase